MVLYILHYRWPMKRFAEQRKNGDHPGEAVYRMGRRDTIRYICAIDCQYGLPRPFLSLPQQFVVVQQLALGVKLFLSVRTHLRVEQV